jgi:hypothetical protein
VYFLCFAFLKKGVDLMKKTWKKWVAVANVFVFSTVPSVVFAADGVTQTITNISNTIISWINAAKIPLSIVSIGIIGLCFILPSDKLRDSAKKNLLWVAGGIALITLAATIVAGMDQTFSGLK